MVVQVNVPCAACAVHLERIIAGREMLVDHVIRVAGRDSRRSARGLALSVEQGKLGCDALGLNDGDQALVRGRVDRDAVDGQTTNGDIPARDGQRARAPRRLAAERNQRRAGKAWLSGAVDQHRGRDRRQGRDEFDRLDPGPGMSKSIVFVPPVAMLESRIAWRSEPGPLSAVVVTRKTPSVMHELGLERRRPSDWASRAERGEALGSRRRRVTQALQRRVERRERTAVG